MGVSFLCFTRTDFSVVLSHVMSSPLGIFCRCQSAVADLFKAFENSLSYLLALFQKITRCSLTLE